MTAQRLFSSVSLRAGPWLVSRVVVLAWTAFGSTALAEPKGGAPDASGDRFDLVVLSETHARLFQRSLLPGPHGALVRTSTLVPVTEYVSLDAKDLDAPWATDGLDVELSAWGQATLGDASPEHAADGDVQSANVTLRRGPASLRLGRQHVAGGAARYSRFDGADAGIALGRHFDGEVYGGFTVLPRWDARPGYYLLGAAADTTLKDPAALPAPSRSGTWLAGARAGWRASSADASLSFHEERSDGFLARRNLGADAHADLPFAMAASGSALVDLDARKPSNLRVSANGSPAPVFDVAVDYAHTVPALLLSHQSVLSVFGTDAYDEIGGYATWRAARALRFEGSGFLDVYTQGRPGSRVTGVVRMSPDVAGRTVARVEYGRVETPDNGYHAIRLSLIQRFSRAIDATLESYGYFYDRPIHGVSTSSVQSGTVSFPVERCLRVLLAGSLLQSPYARFDTQAQVRLEYALDASRREGGR